MMAEHFDDASSWLTSTPAAASLPNETKLELYGLFKLAKTGSGPTTSRPGMFAFEAKAKYDAWVRVAAEYDVERAKIRYVQIAQSIGYTPEDEGEGRKSRPTGMGPSVSIMTSEEAEAGDSSVIHDAAASGSVNDLKAIIALDPSLLDRKDEFGYTPLHLAADRGHAEAVACLLSSGANKVALDQDGQTALEIAQISGREDVVKLLS